ncbi:MAG TPA: hypothetical protein DD706_06195 [Nitrospiraceae bacterium]|nr:hypothetical protein [Nitrospiraceae bacterium]
MISGGLKHAATGVLAPRPCSRTRPYAPLIQAAAVLLDGLFEHSTNFLLRASGTHRLMKGQKI